MEELKLENYGFGTRQCAAHIKSRCRRGEQPTRDRHYLSIRDLLRLSAPSESAVDSVRRLSRSTVTAARRAAISPAVRAQPCGHLPGRAAILALGRPSRFAGRLALRQSSRPSRVVSRGHPSHSRGRRARCERGAVRPWPRVLSGAGRKLCRLCSAAAAEARQR